MNRFTFVMMNFPSDPLLTGLLKKSLDSGIKTIFWEDDYFINIIFNDGSLLKGWNCNKFYGWLSSGEITCTLFKNSYKWDKTRPSKEIMARLYKMINNFIL